MRLNHYTFGQPASQRFYTEDTGGGSGGDAGAGTSGGESSSAAAPVIPEGHVDTPTPAGKFDIAPETQVKPDFSSLKRKETSPAKAPEPKTPPETHEKVEKPADGAQGDGAAVKKDEQKAEKEPAKPKIPDDDKDIDEIRPRPGSGVRIQNDFERLKTAAKEARAETREAAKQLTELKSKLETFEKGGAIPEEIKTKVEQAEKIEKDYKELRRMLEQENDPDFQREHQEKITGAEKALFDYLEKGGLPKEILDEIKEDGIEGWKDTEGKSRWEELKAQIGNDLTWQEILSLRKGRLDAIRGQEGAIETLRKDATAWEQQRQERTKANFQQWASKAKDAAMKVADLHSDIFGEREITEKMTAEEKKSAEGHNAKVGAVAKEIQDLMMAGYQRDPEKLATAAMKAKAYDLLLPEKDAEIGKLNARIKDLETRIAGVRKVSERDPVTPPANGEVKGIDGLDKRNAGEAMKDFFSKK